MAWRRARSKRVARYCKQFATCHFGELVGGQIPDRSAGAQGLSRRVEERGADKTVCRRADMDLNDFAELWIIRPFRGRLQRQVAFDDEVADTNFVDLVLRQVALTSCCVDIFDELASTCHHADKLAEFKMVKRAVFVIAPHQSV